MFGEFMCFVIHQYVHGIYPEMVTIGPMGPFKLPVERLLPGGFETFHEGHFEGLSTYVFGIKDLLVLTCIIGVAHMTLGYLLGMRNEAKQHGLKTAILHKGSWLLILFGGVALVWYIFPLMIAGTIGAISVTDPLFIAGAALLVFGVIMLLIGEGPIGILEILLDEQYYHTRPLAVGLSGRYRLCDQHDRARWRGWRNRRHRAIVVFITDTG
jgi:V/A-type H+-transporting ATPase subunit I